MDADFKSKWVAALRGGNYEQGRGRLRTSTNGYCCWGVLCDLLDPEGWTRIGPDGPYSFRGRQFLPPSDLMETIGIQCPKHTILSSMNDTGVGFASIADYIEGHL
jgi:hypothetical protein